MQVEQLSLLPIKENSDTDNSVDEESNDRSFVSCKSNPVDTMVSVYIIYDPITTKRYVGISQSPDTRLKNYQQGNGANMELDTVCRDRWDLLSKNIYNKFRDEFYTPTNPNCRSRMIEAFAINYFDSIENGFNKYLGFHHDYTDTDYWEDVLPEEFILLYRTSNHETLNQRSLKHVRNTTPVDYGNSTHNLHHKLWAIDYLLSLKDRGVSVQKLGKELVGLDRSNLHRVLNERKYNSISAKKLYQLVRAIENHLGISPVECPYLDDLDIDKLKERSN